MKLILFIFLSLALHLILLLGAGRLSLESDKETSFSKNLGQSSIKARLMVREKVKAPKTGRGKLKKEKAKKKRAKSKVEDLSKSDQKSGSETELSKYLSEIRELILKRKYKGPIAKRLNLTGLVKVSFKIESPNKLKALKVIKSSGKRPLDDSAMETVRRIGILPNIPSRLELKEITINLEMEFE